MGSADATLRPGTTEVLIVDPAIPDPAAIARAAAIVRAGGLVAFPTETVYGLGANALDAAAVRRVFEAKGRPAEDPLIVHLAAAEDLDRVAGEVPGLARRLAEAFWPGPLTLVLPKRPAVPAEVTAGLPTVAVRVPAHPVALALIRAADVPVAAPSANRFGRASPTSAQHVLDDLEGRVDLVLDAGPTAVGVESTVLDLTRDPPTILRPGGVAREAIERVAGRVAVAELSLRDPAGAPSPGLLASHYAVTPELIVVECPTAVATTSALARIAELARAERERGRRVGVILAEEDPVDLPPEVEARRIGSAEDLAAVARGLFAAMRELEALGVDVILARTFGAQGLGLAIRDRLRRAATRLLPG